MLAFIQFIRLVKKAKTLPYFYPPPRINNIYILLHTAFT